MKRLTLYKILSYILLPIGVLVGFVTLVALLLALGNMGILLSVFITGATVIYIFSSFVFLKKGLMALQPCRPGLKDLVKVNAYVALVFAILGLVQSIGLVASPEIMQAFVNEMMKMQPEQVRQNKEAFIHTLYPALYFMIAVCVILQVHVNLTLRYLRDYRHLFGT